jgi:hypothetical protein
MNARPILFKTPQRASPAQHRRQAKASAAPRHAHHVGQDITHASFNVIVAEEARYGAG